jgi:hypothetical protein
MDHRRGIGLYSGVLVLACLAAGCGGGDTPSAVDGAVTDAGKVDLGTSDDAGMADDAGTPNDTGAKQDAGVADAGAMDGGAADGGTTDGGAIDGGTTDGGAADAGRDGGARGRAHAGASLVSAGSLMRSASFQMISTLGGRSVQQTTLQSPNFRLRGGLVGTIGAR